MATYHVEKEWEERGGLRVSESKGLLDQHEQPERPFFADEISLCCDRTRREGKERRECKEGRGEGGRSAQCRLNSRSHFGVGAMSDGSGAR